MESSSSLVGRESELEYLMGHMSRAISGSGSLIMIAGEAGSGKTTLCEAFERLAVKSGCQVLVGRCVPGPHTPYLVFMEAFHGFESDPFVDPNIMNEGSKLLLSVLNCIEKLAEERPLILRLEDLHWADSASVSMLHFLARNIRKSRVMLIGTYRPEDLHLLGSGEAHPLIDAIRVMRREAVCHVLELEPLTTESTMRLVGQILDGPAEDRLKGHVANESRGNPLFAVEMLRYLAGSEQIRTEDGVWKLHLDKKAQTPTTIREVILARVDHLPHDARRVLEIASVIGERFKPELIENIYRDGRTALIESLETLEDEFRLIVELEDRYRFSHEKVRQVVYEGISQPRRKELHRLIGLQLEKGLPDDELLGPLSEHFLVAGEKRKGVTYAMASGRLYHHRKAVKEAKDQFLTVLRSSEGDDSYIPERLEALESLGDLKNDASSPREWFSFYDRFLELSKDRAARARVLAKAAECWDQFGLNDVKKAYQLLDEAEVTADGDPRALAEIAYRRADLSGNEGNIVTALVQIRQARSRFEELGDPVSTSKCVEAEIAILRQALRFREARDLAEAQLKVVQSLDDPEPLLRVEMLAGFICAVTGDTETAKRYTTEVIELASRLGMMWNYRLSLYCRAIAKETEGDVTGAIVDTSKALENAREYESSFHAVMFGINLGLYKTELGMLEEANVLYEEACKATANFDPYARFLLDLDLSVLFSELLWSAGKIRESEEAYKQTIAHAKEHRDPFEYLICCVRFGMSLARSGSKDDAKRYMTEALELAEGLGCQARVKALAGRVGLSI